MAVAGVLPFSGIYIELYDIIGSVWGHRIYIIYGLLFIIFAILIIVTAFTTVALTYVQLASKDHNWWWSPEIVPMWRFHCAVHFQLLCIGYDGFHAVIVFLWLLGLHLLRLLPHAWDCWVSSVAAVHPPYISVYQM